MLVPMFGNYKAQILILADTTLCFSYSQELEERRWKALFNLLNININITFTCDPLSNSIVFSSPLLLLLNPFVFPPPPSQFYCFPSSSFSSSSSSSTILLFSLLLLLHNSIVFPPPPPPQFYCFSSSSSTILFFPPPPPQFYFFKPPPPPPVYCVFALNTDKCISNQYLVSCSNGVYFFVKRTSVLLFGILNIMKTVDCILIS